MTITVDPTKGGNENTHHIKLTDSSGTVVGLVCADSSGDKVPNIAVSPYPTMASQLRMGKGRYADRVPPFEDVPMSDFSGGMAMLHYDEDSSRYLDGKMCDTTEKGRVAHGGLPSYASGIRDFDENWPGDVDWQALYSGGTESVTKSFTCSAIDDDDWNANSIILILKKVGSPTGNVTAYLLDSGGSTLKSKALTIGTDCLTDLESELVEFEFSSVQDVNDGTTYKVKAEYTGGDSDNYVQVAVDGSTEPYYRVLDDSDDIDGIFFELNGGLYFVTQPLDKSASTIYLYGDRGVAYANTGALTTLVDGSKSWTNDEWIGGVVKIIAEDGTEEREPYRTITDNDSTSLTVSPAWKVTHSTETEYVILYPKWQSVETLDQYCMSVTVSAGYAVLAFESGAIEKYEAKEYGGAFQEGLYSSDQAVANHVLALANDIRPNNILTNTLYGVHTATSFARIMKYDYLSSYTRSSKTLAYQCALMETRKPFDYDNNASVTSYLRDTWTQIDMSGAVNGKLCGYKLPSAVDIRGGRYVRLIIYAQTTARDAGDLQLRLKDSAGDTVSLDFPALSANETTLCELSFSTPPEADSNYDASEIAEIQIVSTTSIQQTFFILQNDPTIGVFQYGYAADRQWFMPINTQVNSIIEYAGGSGEVVRKPWIFTWDGPWYLSGDYFTKLYLGELEELSHPDNGKGVCVNDVYLYFNVGPTVQRYYAGHLDSVGPDIDYGLPANRLGIPLSAASYPGRVLFGIDAGSSGYSSLIMRRSHGWNEFYRAPKGHRIRRIHAYARADTTDKVFILQGADILEMPISINHETESDYEYNYESTLTTSRIYGGLRETEKYYHAITLVTENLSSTHRWIEVDYKTSENSTWTNISTKFTSSPRQRQSLSSSNNITGRWIQFRFRSYTDDADETPILVSAIVDSLERLDSANTYSYNVRIKAGFDTDLLGTTESSTGEDKWGQIETWVDDPLPLTLNSSSVFENGKLVFIEPERCRVLYHFPDYAGGELRVYQLTLIEVE